MREDQLTVIQKLHQRVNDLPIKLQHHIMRVLFIALDLGNHHKIPWTMTTMAVLGHDLYRHLTEDEILEKAKKNGLVLKEKSYEWHGQLAAFELATAFHIEDISIINAVADHTRLRYHRDSPLASLVFVADKLDPAKGLEPKLIETARTDLAEAVKLVAEHQQRRFGE